jgi:hypothetical protein
MKTGRPDYPIPSPQTVSQDVRNVFVGAHKRIAKMLQVRTVSSLKIKIENEKKKKRNTRVL